METITRARCSDIDFQDGGRRHLGFVGRISGPFTLSVTLNSNSISLNRNRSNQGSIFRSGDFRGWQMPGGGEMPGDEIL